MANLTKEQRAVKAAEDAAKAIAARALEISGLDADAFAALPDDERNATLAQAQAESESEQSASKANADDKPLVAMRKGSESLRVHPTCVADHKSLGWVED
jgi:hypothetical protein